MYASIQTVHWLELQKFFLIFVLRIHQLRAI